MPCILHCTRVRPFYAGYMPYFVSAASLTLQKLQHVMECSALPCHALLVGINVSVMTCYIYITLQENTSFSALQPGIASSVSPQTHTFAHIKCNMGL